MGTSSFTPTTLNVNGISYQYYSIDEAAKKLRINLNSLPISLKILVENLLRFSHTNPDHKDDVMAFDLWLKNKENTHEIAYYPSRVLMQDFTGVPAVVDLAAMRDAMLDLGGDPSKINPLTPVDLVIDHSVQVDYFASPQAFEKNVAKEMERNVERYQLLRSAQKMFRNFRTVPPGTGICHQVNLEYLSRVVWTKDENGVQFAYPDTVVGTDSHTTMVNGLAVLGWGVGAIEAESAMLGQPISMTIPAVIGFKMTGEMQEGTTATDLVLTVTKMLREKGVVEKFVEFYGPGLSSLSLADRATIANMAPEYGATCGFFPIDQETLRYLRLSGRTEQNIALVEAYAKAQGMWHTDNYDPVVTDSLVLDLATIEPCLAGPKRPQDKVNLTELKQSIAKQFPEQVTDTLTTRYPVQGSDYTLGHGDVVIAAITSCTNTSNPYVMLAAALLAKNAIDKGLTSKPWVKTSLAPGSQVVTEYLNKSNLQYALNELGFNLVGYGCTTCIGNSGPLDEPIAAAIKEHRLVAASVLSGNRNFEGRIHPHVKANYLASPPLVVAYALAGTVNIDLHHDPLGTDKQGNPVYLKDIWPAHQQVTDLVAKMVTPLMFNERYSDVFTGDELWQSIPTTDSQTYAWNPKSTYIKKPPYFYNMKRQAGTPHDIANARILALFGDSITTDHISPAGAISKQSPAAQYLISKGVEPHDFNSYGARRGNDDVMVRGTFANIRIRNEMAPGTEGGYTTHQPSGDVLTIFEAASLYKATQTPLVIFAGKDYGMGSSRDWAAKGTLLLGVKAVISESFERIHRSNLVGMGVLPLTFMAGTTRKTLNLLGNEIINIIGLDKLKPQAQLQCLITRANGAEDIVPLLCRIDTEDELEYYYNGGILHRVIRQFLA